MAFNIDTFATTLAGKGGLLRLAHHRTRFTPPAGLATGSGVSYRNTGVSSDDETAVPDATTTARFLEFYGEMSTLPGVAATTIDTRRYGYGPGERKPISATFNPVNMSFYVDADGDVSKFFHDWMKLTVNFDMRSGMRALTGIGTNQFPFEVSYKSAYATDIEIAMFSQSGGSTGGAITESIVYTLMEAHPVQVHDVVVNWAEGGIVRLPVTFNYFGWHERRLTVNDANVGSRNRDGDERNSDDDEKKHTWRRRNGKLYKE